eukprot:scaffold10030_cov285-Amphora_coffeaeformis.AAC.5
MLPLRCGYTPITFAWYASTSKDVTSVDPTVLVANILIETNNLLLQRYPPLKHTNEMDDALLTGPQRRGTRLPRATSMTTVPE